MIQGLHPHFVWRLGLVLLGGVSYYESMMMVGARLIEFRRVNQSSQRIRSLSWTPYFTDGILAALAGVFNPAGLFYVVASALPSTLGANAGLLSLPSMTRIWRPTEEPVGPILRSTGWITTAAVASVFFIFLLGRGISWAR